MSRDGSSVGRLLAAWVVALSGPIAAVRGWGTTVVYAPVAGRGQWVLAAVVLVWLVVGSCLRRPWRLAVGQIAATALGAWATWDTIGRTPAIVAISGAGVAAFASGVWPTREGDGPRPVATLALVPLVAAELLWAARAQLAGTMVLLALAVALTVVYERAPARVEPFESARRQAAASFRRRVAGVRAGITSRTLVVATVGLAIGGVWAPVFWRLTTKGIDFDVLGINDFPLHVEVARDFSLHPLHIEAPHLLFHATTWAWSALLSDTGAPVATLVTTTALTFAAVVMILGVAPRRGEGLQFGARIGVATAYMFMETPTVLLLALGWLPATTPFTTVHWWGNPTWLTSLPFTLLAFPLLERFLDDLADPNGAGGGPPRRAPWQLALVLVLGTLAKPTLVLCLVPVLPVYLLAVRRAPVRSLVPLATWAIAPPALVTLWQIWFIAESPSSRFSSGWVIDPIVQPAYGWGHTGPAYWLPFGLVVLALVVTKGSFVREPMVGLALTAFGPAILLMLTVRETGDRATHGNFGVPAQACAAVLVLLAVRSIVLQAAAARSLRSPGWTWWVRRFVGPAVLVVFVASGVVDYLDAVGVIDVPMTSITSLRTPAR